VYTFTKLNNRRIQTTDNALLPFVERLGIGKAYVYKLAPCLASAPLVYHTRTDCE